jgi:hypothetical protein
MSNRLPYFPEDETEPLPLGKWLDELTGLLSQCYCHIQHQGVDYILYLRWRWIDPWQAYVIKNADSLSSMNNGQAIWSFDVFEIQHLEYRDVELKHAKQAMIRLFHEYDGNFIQLRLLHPHR